MTEPDLEIVERRSHRRSQRGGGKHDLEKYRYVFALND